VHCPNCSTDNPSGAKFCIECGTPLQNRCSNCEYENPPLAKFCAECGTSLTGKAKVKRQKAKSKSENSQDKRQAKDSVFRTLHSELTAAERRQLTVMFCDLVDSTALSEQLDPEEYGEVVRTYQQTSADVIERFEGYIAQYLGDGLLVYFGYPQAHEDDAARAVRAGLEIIQAIKEQVTEHSLQKGKKEVGAQHAAPPTR